MIIGAKWGKKVDVWSLGCVVAELWTEKVLFDNDSIHTLLASQQSIAGPFSRSFLRRGPLAYQYFCEPTDDTASTLPIYEVDGSSVSMLHNISTSLEATLVSVRGANDIEIAAGGQLAAFLQPLLQLDPECRATAAQSLADRWLLSN